MSLSRFESDAGIRWGAAKAVCDFADGEKGLNKEENQRKAASEAARFVYQAIADGRFLSPGVYHSSNFEPQKYNGDPPDKRIHDLGLVDLALQRKDLTWNFISKSLDDLIDSIPEKGEYFIVARSMEMWVNNRPGQPETYLGKLAHKVTHNQLRCIFVLPERGLKSLVLSDPSQGVQEKTWQQIETVLQNAIGVGQGSQNDTDLEHGIIEIYTIPAYVPSTFSKISSREGVEYCSLEVGIGIPPGEDRVLLYFEKNKNPNNIFERLYAIYKGIIDEREPKYKFPAYKMKAPEDPLVIAKLYHDLIKGFQDHGFHTAHWHENRDWFTRLQPAETDQPAYRENNGTAACISVLPLPNYIGGKDVLRTISELRDQFKALLDAHPNDASKFQWVADEQVIIPIFYYKSSFSDAFISPFDDPAEKEALVACISKHKPFRVQFKHFVIDHWGRIMLLGYPTAGSTEELSSLRSDLLSLAKSDFRRFNSRRPQDFICLFGRINQELTDELLEKLRYFTDEHFHLSTKAELEIDQLRLVKLDGSFLSHRMEALGHALVLKTSLLEPGSYDTYGILARGKWLGHPHVVEKIKTCSFDEIRPITVHFSPSLDCVYACPTCSYGASKETAENSDDRKMSREDMFSSIDKLKRAHVRGLIFTGGGEPLTNPHTLDGMLYAKRIGLSVGLFTNGSLLDSDAAELLMSADNDAPDFIRFSINAGTPEAYGLIHGCALEHFDRVLDNLSSLCEAKLRKNAATKLDIGVLVTPAFLDSLIDLAVEIKRLALHHPGALNSMLFRPAVNYRGGNQKNQYTTKLMENPHFGANYRAFFCQAQQFDSQLFEKSKEIIIKRVRPLLMDESDCRVEVSFPEIRLTRAAMPVFSRPFQKCLAHNLVAFVSPDTSIYRCVEQALDSALCMGKLRDVSSLNQLWQNDTLKRNHLDFERCPPVCLLYETNLIWDQLAKKKETGVSLEELAHHIDIAKEFFDRQVAPLIGEAVNFI